MSNIKTIVVAIITSVVVLGVAIVGARLVGNQSADVLGASGGITRYPNGGIAARYLKVTTSANTASAGTDGTFSIGGGTEIDLFKCATATWNPGNLEAASSTISSTSTAITVSGATTGDPCVASLTSATSTLMAVSCHITGSDTATVEIQNLRETAHDAPSGTAKACIISQ